MTEKGNAEVLLRLPKELLEVIDNDAKKARRTRTAQIILMLENGAEKVGV